MLAFLSNRVSAVGTTHGSSDQADPSAARQGLYRPSDEHDACGVGFVAHIKGARSHSIVRSALDLLINLEHRGACGSDPDTGDGAGILIQMPDRFFRSRPCRSRCRRRAPTAPAWCSSRTTPAASDACKAIVERIVAEEGQTLLGWRAVPIDLVEGRQERRRRSRRCSSSCSSARSGPPDGGHRDSRFERDGFTSIRKRIERSSM